VAAYVLIPSSDVQLAQGIADLHIQIEVGTQESAWRGHRLMDKATSSRESTLVVQKKSESAPHEPAQ
jgi:hypothetical protein